MTIERIISGGQTGADQAGLAAAKILGLKTGGYMPRGFRTEAGSRRDFISLYGMLEHSSPAYPLRTEFNIINSGGTLIFGNANSPGCILTWNLCVKHFRDVMMVPWKSGNPIPDPEPFYDWLKGRSWTVLNVAGNRESKNPGVFEACKAFLIATFQPRG